MSLAAFDRKPGGSHRRPLQGLVRAFAARRTISLLALALTTSLAAAQELPQKTITIVVGFVAGGGADTAARIIGRKLSENL